MMIDLFDLLMCSSKIWNLLMNFDCAFNLLPKVINYDESNWTTLIDPIDLI